MEKVIARPFVKWVGGKTQLLTEIKRSISYDLGCNTTYVEPFVGGGAVLFWILQEYPNIKHAVINDINSKLICTYKQVKYNVAGLIQRLDKIQAEYIPLNEDKRKEYYLKKRQLFNSYDISELDIAALFIFLNRTCYNGLYRVNSKGDFNVPHGRYRNPLICDKENLRAVSNVLQRVEILCGDFSKTGKYASVDSLYYFDPPYKPLNKTAAFTSYDKNGFDDAEQIRLRDFCSYVAQQGGRFIASNSDPESSFFDDIYGEYNIKRVSATRVINSNTDKRGVVSEIMVSNI